MFSDFVVDGDGITVYDSDMLKATIVNLMNTSVTDLLPPCDRGDSIRRLSGRGRDASAPTTSSSRPGLSSPPGELALRTLGLLYEALSLNGRFPAMAKDGLSRGRPLYDVRI